VRVVAAARGQKKQSYVATLVTDVFCGRQPRPLPESVAAALAGLPGGRRPPGEA
jgi:hypothetical protein